MTALATRAKDELRIFDDLLKDKKFWKEYEQILTEQITPILFEPFLAGFVAGSKLKPKNKALPAIDDVPDWMDPSDLARLAEQAIVDYVPVFTKNISDTTYNAVRDAVTKARENGTGVEGVLKDIQTMFSRGRAETIAVTETTRLFGLGAQASYKAQGFNAWVWMSVNDPWVDAVCAGLSSDSEANPFPMDKLFEPAHPRCRCFPSPVVVEVPSSDYRKLDMTESEAAEWGAKHWGDWLEKMEAQPSVSASLHNYGGGGYGFMNQYLRTGVAESTPVSRKLFEEKGQTIAQAVSEVRKALSKARVPENITTYRRARFHIERDLPESFRDMRVGSILEDKGFMSTSLSEKRFSLEGSTSVRAEYQFAIRVPKGYQGAYISQPYGFKSEQEVLLQADTRLRIVEMTSQPDLGENSWKVIAEVISD